MPLADPRAAADHIVRWFETLTPDSLTGLDDCYTPDATFKDPFNEVKGVDAIRDIFSHMYRAFDEPRFIVTGRIVDGEQCFLIWEFRFRFKRFDTTTLQTVRGGSHLMLADDGRIRMHRDYWDAAEELYEKLPVLGRLMRWLKRHANS
jgi:steroid delta-isomerase